MIVFACLAGGSRTQSFHTITQGPCSLRLSQSNVCTLPEEELRLIQKQQQQQFVFFIICCLGRTQLVKIAFFLPLFYLVFLRPHLSIRAGGLYLIFDLS